LRWLKPTEAITYILHVYYRLKELGGGGVLDIGIYCVQFASLVFGGEKPTKVITGGHLNSHGVDESTSSTLLYPNGKTATLITHCKVELPNEVSKHSSHNTHIYL
jgi:dihydrodiol dehydrogenase / D-xylose 1-dehydrogenase (NADP)